MTKEVTEGLERLLAECEDSERMAIVALSECELHDAEGTIEAWDDCRRLTAKVREALALARFEYSSGPTLVKASIDRVMSKLDPEPCE